MDFVTRYLDTTQRVAEFLKEHQYELLKVIDDLVHLKSWQGRLFIIGVGGGAGNASHAVSDFRNIARIEAHTPTDNVSEFTAQINDDSWGNSFVGCLRRMKIKSDDMLLILSVGGGNKVDNISSNIVEAIDYVKQKKARIIAIIGKKENSHAYQEADTCIVIQPVEADLITPLTESFQSLLVHMFVNHPKIKEG